MGADTKTNTWELVRAKAAYLMDCSVVLPVRPSARAAPPLGPRLFFTRLRTWEREAGAVRVSMGADTKANTQGRGALEISDLRLLEDGSERSDALVSDVIASEAARNR